LISNVLIVHLLQYKKHYRIFLFAIQDLREGGEIARWGIRGWVDDDDWELWLGTCEISGSYQKKKNHNFTKLTLSTKGGTRGVVDGSHPGQGENEEVRRRGWDRLLILLIQIHIINLFCFDRPFALSN
jgi:hypothetical protein